MNAILGEIISAMASGDRVELRGFGAFSVKHRPARTGRNPRTGAHVSVERNRFRSSRPARRCASVSTGRAERPRGLGASERVARQGWIAAARPVGDKEPQMIRKIVTAPQFWSRLRSDLPPSRWRTGEPSSSRSIPSTIRRPPLSVAVPLFALVLGLLILGVAIGGIAAWARQSRWRRKARIAEAQARDLRAEVDTRLERRIGPAELVSEPLPGGGRSSPSARAAYARAGSPTWGGYSMSVHQRHERQHRPPRTADAHREIEERYPIKHFIGLPRGSVWHVFEDDALDFLRRSGRGLSLRLTGVEIDLAHLIGRRSESSC